MTKEDQFERWWECYPRKVAKGNARKAFAKAIKLASMEELLDGVTRYVANKPGYCDYAHPASWLNAERWSDQWEPPQPKAPRYGNPEYKPSSRPSQTREEYIRAEIERAERSFR